MNKLNHIRIFPQARHQHDGNGIDLTAIARTLWWGRYRIVIVIIIASFLGGLYATMIAVPLYPANAVVALEIKQKNVASVQSVLSGSSGATEEINTEVEVIRSRYLNEALVKKLNLINDPEFNKALQGPSKYNPISYLNSTFNIKEQKPTPQQTLNAVVNAVISAISVSNIRQSLAFSINITTENPDKSALIVNALAGLYIQDSLNKKLKATELASDRLSKKAAELKLKLEYSEAQIKQFNDRTQLISPEALGALSVRLKETRTRIFDLGARKSLLQANVARIGPVLESGDIRGAIGQIKNPQLMHIAKDVDAGKTSQSVLSLQVADIFNKMQQDAKRLGLQYNALQVSEKLLKTEVDTQTADLMQLQNLRRDAQANGLLYESFLTRLKETIIQQGLQESDIRLLSSAVPTLAASPKVSVIITVSALLGSILSGGLVLLRAHGNNTFHTADDLEAYTGYEVLGAVPKLKTKDQNDALTYIKDKPASMFAEAVRNLRTSILLSDFGRQPQVIMMTSSVPGEGKTTQVLTLAQNMAGLGKTVLVIEGDIRKRTLSERFNVREHFGFLSAMSGEAALEDAIFKPCGTGIDLLLGEGSKVNAADIFSSVAFAGFISMLRQKYDYIIIDTAPVLAVPDARIIGQHADILLYVVLWNGTLKMQVKQGLAMLKSVGLSVSGLILNKVDSAAMKQYGCGDQFGCDDASEYYLN
ncbi:MAG: polysaccharide biosynthesis tyrosine autokinase [Proteobacteria bacterium]|nr:polysaccharide biosynthesis tyrosine autokinase [Pseudomonadota bacterium]